MFIVRARSHISKVENNLLILFVYLINELKDQFSAVNCQLNELERQKMSGSCDAVMEM